MIAEFYYIQLCSYVRIHEVHIDFAVTVCLTRLCVMISINYTRLYGEV